MKKPIGKDTIVKIGFYGGLFIKAFDGVIEFFGGIILAVLSLERLNALLQSIALPELTEDPKDALMNYFITVGQNFSISSQHAVAIYMLLHGGIKLIVIWLLWTKKIWAYPFAAAVFCLFVCFEIYSCISKASLLLMILIAVDVLLIVLIILEYKRLKKNK